MDVREADDAHVHEDPDGLPELCHGDNWHLLPHSRSLDVGLLQQKLEIVLPEHPDEDIEWRLALLHTPRPKK